MPLVRGVVVGLLGLGVLAGCGDDGGEQAQDAQPVATTAAVEPVNADDIPVAHTPPGGWTDWPEPVLAGCTEPLVDGAPELAGLWRVRAVEVGGEAVPGHPAEGAVQRIEQCGDRLVVTAAGIIHDMRVDGTEANGVNDVAELDKTTPITVVATYEDGVHVLRPVGLDGVEVTRRRVGDEIEWGYVTFTARLERIGDPTDTPPPTT